MHLINEMSQVREYVNIGHGLSIDTLRPSLNDVEMNELTFYLGSDLLQEIIEAANTYPLNISPAIARIYQYTIAFNAGLAVYKAMPEIEVLVNDNGVQRIETDNEKTAYGGQIKRFRDLAANRAYNALDRLLLLLSENESDYPSWEHSEYYQSQKGLLLTSPKDFANAGESIKNSFLTFQALIPLIREVQENQIKPFFPLAMWEDLFLKPETYYYLLTHYIRPAIAKFTLQEAIVSLPVQIDHESVTIDQLSLAGDQRTNTTPPIHLLEKKSWSLHGKGGLYLSRLKEYLNTNHKNFPLWSNSDFYSETLKSKIERSTLPDNERKIYRA